MEGWILKIVSDTKIIKLKNKFYSNRKNEKITANFKYNGLKFSWLYRNIKFKYKIIIAILIAIIMGMITLFFVKNSGLYSVGLGGLSQGISRLVGAILLTHQVNPEKIKISTDVIFWGFTILINIPGLIFSWYKIGKEFTILTGIYVIISNIFPLGITQIPGIENIHIFGDVTTNSPGFGDLKPPPALNFLLWQYDGSKVPSLVFYGLTSSLLAAIPLSFSYVIGGSSGGFDVLAIYWMKVKRKALGTILFITNIFILLITSTLGSFVALGLISISNPSIDNYFIIENFFSPNLLVSVILLLLLSILINKIYPRFKMIGIKLISLKEANLNEKMFDSEFDHARLITKGTGGYTKKEFQIITIYCFIFEANEIIAKAKVNDKDVFIVIEDSVHIEGRKRYEEFLR